MIKKLYIIILICVLCAACGVKSEPEYKSQVIYIKNIKII